MNVETKRADGKGRVVLGRDFANTPVILEHVSATEVRIRKAIVVPEDEVRFREEAAAPLSDRDREVFLDLLDHPPEANEALRRALSRERDQNG